MAFRRARQLGAVSLSLPTTTLLDSFRIADHSEAKQRMIRDVLKGLGECAQILPEALGIAITKERFNFQVCTPPNWNGTDKQAPPFCR